MEHGGANVVSRRCPGVPKLEKGDFNMPYKVIVWGAGQKGALAVKEAIEHPDLELVGVLVFSDAKAGRDAAELYGGTTPSGIIATQSQERILSLDADVVIHARRREPDPTPMNDEVCAILKSGKNVISISGFIWPWAHGAGLPARLEQACREGGASLYGTGIVPGFVGERLAVTLTGLTLRCDGVFMREVFDVTWEVPHKLFNVIGVGREPGWHDPNSIVAKTQNYYFEEEIHAIAHLLGVKLDKVESVLETPLATRDLDLKHGKIAKGTVGAISWSWIGYVEGKPFIHLENVWWVDEALEQFQNQEGWQIIVKGDTELKLRLETGERDKIGYQIIGPALRAIPYVCSAPAGIVRQPAFAPWSPGYKKPSAVVVAGSSSV